MMQIRTTTLTIAGALLAFYGSLAPKLSGCSLPGLGPIRIPAAIPASFGFLPAAGAANQPSTGPAIVGLWSVTFYSGGVIVDQAFDVWHSDGTEVLNDYTNPIEGNVCLGVWAQTSGGAFKLKHPSWTFDASGNLTGTAEIDETVTVGPNGSAYEGSYTISFFDLQGNPIGTYPGAIKATRVFQP